MIDGGDKMTVGMILDFPGVTDADYSTAWRLQGAAAHVGNLFHLVPPVEPGAALFFADAADAEPT
jgi:hypothetical protein